MTFFDNGATSIRGTLLGGASLVAMAFASPALADDAALMERLSRLEAQVAAQSRQLDAQEVRLDQQERLIESQRLEVRSLHAERDEMLTAVRAGAGAVSTPDLNAAEVRLAQNSQTGVGPTAEENVPPRVGEAPPREVRHAREVAAVPEFASVLTPKGKFVLDPSVEYNRSSSNRLVFRGVEIVPGINFGLLEANDADRDAGVATLSGRYGLSRRLEVQASVPYVVRHDRITTVATPNDSTSRKTVLDGHGLGDVELAARYQFNNPPQGMPFLVGNMRIKPPTGEGPYDVRYDQFGVAQELAVGSGFWGIEGGVTAILPTDPAVLFASLSYLYNVKRDIDKTYGSGDNALYVAEVDPGDSIAASLGFGLALNQRFSFSLGYAHAYYFRSNSWIGNSPTRVTKQPTESFQVGTLNLGLSYRVTPRITVNNNFQFGMTSDAPDMRVVFRVPYGF